MSASAPEATKDDSTGTRASRPPTDRPGRTHLGLTGLAMIAALLLIVSTFLPLFEISTQGAELRTYSGLQHHSIAMLLLGVAAIVMGLGALRGARPAMAALGVIGIIVIVVALTVDLPAALDEGVLAVTYENAQAAPGSGFFAETLGGALLLLAGGLMLLRGRTT